MSQMNDSHLHTKHHRHFVRCLLDHEPHALSGVCVVCGCSQDNCADCIDRSGGPCDWANDAHTLCTVCADILDVAQRRPVPGIGRPRQKGSAK